MKIKLGMVSGQLNGVCATDGFRASQSASNNKD